MIPKKTKHYLIHHTPNREAGDKQSYFWGYGECLSESSNGGFFTFRLSNGDLGMFSEEDIITEHYSEDYQINC